MKQVQNINKKICTQPFLLIIPAYNEEKKFPQTLIPAIDFLKNKSFTSEIIVVSDVSQKGFPIVHKIFSTFKC